MSLNPVVATQVSQQCCEEPAPSYTPQSRSPRQHECAADRWLDTQHEQSFDVERWFQDYRQRTQGKTIFGTFKGRGASR